MWRTFLKYPQHIRPEHQDLLDTLAEIMPPVDYHDKYVTMGLWLNKASDEGLITIHESAHLRHDIANNL